MEKTLYLAMTIEKNGKYYSWVQKVKSCYCLVHYFKQFPGLVSANVCDTLKIAKQIVGDWNDAYKQNGTYLFDYPLF